jgi:adenylate cyclase class 1
VSDQLPTLQLGAPGEEISFRDLRSISKRFKKLHHFKRESIRHILNSSQRQFLDALPLILDANHPALPGFISSATPAGIFDYQPDNRTLDAARKINRSFNYQPRRRNNSNAAIDGLFLMGSVGSLAFTKSSDIDIWLCHRAGLTAQEFDELQKKTKALESWAASLHLEVHFFLINSKQFPLDQKKPVSADSSGDTQHYLLLEEFYRTSVYIAGKDLAWWLVPPEHENDYEAYLAHLLECRFIDADQILDLGGLAYVPADEFISATQWHIYKALHSPYKSLLKLSLMECYASEYPAVDWLSIEIKRSVYQGKLTGLGIDPYVLIYRKLENYLLKSQSHERLAMVREIFYRKVIEGRNDQHHLGSFSLYEDYFHEISVNWQGPNNAENFPNGRNLWDIEKALAENNAIIRQLALCHSKIVRFAHDHIDSEFRGNKDMRLLARKLIAFFERKQGKIEVITVHGSEIPIKPNLSIIEDGPEAEHGKWGLFCDKKNQQDETIQAPLYRRQTLIEILCWLTVNGFYRHGTPIRYAIKSLNLTGGELNTILNRLDTFFKKHFDFSDSLGNYAGSNGLTHSLLIINIGQTPPEMEAGPYVITSRSNPLSHGTGRECLIRTIDRVSVSHWNEVLSSHGRGIEGLCDCLTGIVNETPQSGTADSLTVICHTLGHAHNIIRHIKKLFEDLLQLHHTDSSNPAPRYLMAGGERYFVFSKQNGRLQYQQARDEAHLINLLSSPRELYGSVAFDVEVLAQTPIPAIYRENRPHTVQCFVYQENSDTRVYILDEKGSLFTRQHPDTAQNQIVNQYGRFLHSVLSRKTIDAASMQFYELRKSAPTVWSFRPIPFDLPSEQEQNRLRVAVASLDSVIPINLSWNGIEFTAQHYGDRLFETVRERIIEFRRNGENYPIYITELDLPLSAFGTADAEGLQMLHFLEHKTKIEARLNSKRL